MHRILWVALWLMTASGMAQTVSLNTWPNGTVDLSGSAADGNLLQGWRVQDGDNPAWAEQEYDGANRCHYWRTRRFRLRLVRVRRQLRQLCVWIVMREDRWVVSACGCHADGAKLAESKSMSC